MIIGHLGGRNAGDDAICVALVGVIKKLVKTNTLLYVYSKNRYIEGMLPSSSQVKIHVVTSLMQVVSSMLSSSIIILAGGDYLDDYGEFKRRLQVYLSFFTLALFTKLAFKGFIIINGGMRVSSAFGLAFTKLILSMIRCFSTRDSQAYDLAAQLNHLPLRGFDNAILLEYATTVKSLPTTHNSLRTLEKRFSLGFSATPFFSNFFRNPDKDKHLVHAMAAGLERFLSSNPNVDVHLLALNSSHSAGDFRTATQLRRMIDKSIRQGIKVIVYDCDIPSFLDKLSGLDAIICCKYHSIVFSFMMGIPFAVINYHPKNAALAEDLGLSQDAIISIGGIMNGELNQLLVRVVRQTADFVADLSILEARRRALNGLRGCLRCVTQSES